MRLDPFPNLPWLVLVDRGLKIHIGGVLAYLFPQIIGLSPEILDLLQCLDNFHSYLLNI